MATATQSVAAACQIEWKVTNPLSLSRNFERYKMYKHLRVYSNWLIHRIVPLETAKFETCMLLFI